MITRQYFDSKGFEYKESKFDYFNTKWYEIEWSHGLVPCFITYPNTLWLDLSDTRIYHKQLIEQLNLELNAE